MNRFAPAPMPREVYAATLNAARPPAAVNDGDVQSGLRRMRRVLAKAGLPAGKVLGRYYAFGPGQERIEGVQVRRIGAGACVSVHAVLAERGAERADDRRWLEAQAYLALWAAGFRPDPDRPSFFRFRYGSR